MSREVTKELLHDFLDYDPISGALRWKVFRGGKAKAGTLAGALDHEGYRLVSLYNKTYKAHRLIWLMMTGAWPEGVIDHIDRNKDNNSFSNLRDCSHSDNKHNTVSSAKRKSIYQGVYIDSRSGKPSACIRLNGKATYVGSFNTEEEAYAAYLSIKEKHYSVVPLELQGLVSNE